MIITEDGLVDLEYSRATFERLLKPDQSECREIFEALARERRIALEEAARGRKTIDKLRTIVGRRGEAIDQLQRRTAEIIEMVKSAEAERDALKARLPKLIKDVETAMDNQSTLSDLLKIERDKVALITGPVEEYFRLVAGDRIELDVWGEMDVLIPAHSGEGGAVQARPCKPGGLITAVGIGDWAGRNGRRITR